MKPTRDQMEGLQSLVFEAYRRGVQVGILQQKQAELYDRTAAATREANDKAQSENMTALNAWYASLEAK